MIVSRVEMRLSPRESGEFISKESKEIQILDDGVENCSEEILRRLKSGQISIEALYKKTELHPQEANDQVWGPILLI